MNEPTLTQPRTLLDRPAFLLAATPLLILLSHYAAVLPHEFSHSIMAWLLGLKSDPLAIDWGGTSLLNILLLIHVDENVDYSTALDAGKHWQVALVAFAGPGLANVGLYLAARFVMAKRVLMSRFAIYCLLWLLFMNLANMFDYVPMRTFSPWDDVAHFRLATGVSPWVIYVVAGYAVLAAIIDFYRCALPASLDASGIQRPVPRACLLVLMTILLFGYFAIPAFRVPDEISHVMGGTSLMSIPVVIWASFAVVVWRHSAASAQSA